MIPKNIWTLWLDGEDHAPPLVRLVFRCWREFNPEWTLRVIDRRHVGKLLISYPDHVMNLPPQALSDILRCHLLNENGGVWVDASVLPAKALRDWLPEQSQSGFFAFDKPGPDRPLASWFLASAPANELVNKWESEVRRYWAVPRNLLMDPREGKASVDDPTHCVSPEGPTGSYPYFWFHYLFGYLVDTQPEFHSIWQASHKLSAVPPHKLQKLLKNPTDAEVTSLFQTYCNAAHVHKLDWRISLPESFVDDVINALPAETRLHAKALQRLLNLFSG